jgi:hypothetical protein
MILTKGEENESKQSSGAAKQGRTPFVHLRGS